MKFPVIIGHHNILTIARANHFDGIGDLDVPKGKLEIGISSRGQAGFQWLLDADGLYYPLHWDGRVPPTWTQRLGLKKRREVYSFPPGSSITVSKLQEMLVDAQDDNADLPHHADLIKLLMTQDAKAPVTRELMQQYLGE